MSKQNHQAKPLMPIEQAQQIIAHTINSVTEIEHLPLQQALGRVLAEEIVSPINVPAFDNSAMDGYALRYQDLANSRTLSNIGNSFAGHAFAGEVGAGQCVRIMTGAVIPQGADTVVMQENTRVEGDQISILADNLQPGEAIRRAGNDIEQHSRVLPAHKRLSPIDIGLLASLGIGEVAVYRKIKVALLSCGDELLAPGQPLQQGKIFESNLSMLHAMLVRLGSEIVNLGIVADDKQAIAEAITQADQQADCLISSGGVSVGEADYTREVLAQIGDVDFWQLAIKPGKPMAFGRLPNSVFFGLPGNPVSAAVTFEQIAAPALALLAGEQAPAKMPLIATASEPFRKRPGRADFQRAHCMVDQQGKLLVEPSGSQSSGVLSSYRRANCYALLEKDRGNVQIGEPVPVELFGKLHG